ncbi:type II toxin-antitoxin system RelE/ParE family toxin, partial [Nitrospirillum viridazoti]|uniref:type II toxin-antitoxin system RelE/ParE family toxin n=1 Tax=Nitrospirillum viridazoti TaxID=3144925 RepID=UPI000C1C9943
SYVEGFNPVAAAKLLQSLAEAALSLEVFPYRGRLGSQANARELVASYPYIIVHRIRNNDVTILRVWHGAQDRG